MFWNKNVNFFCDYDFVNKKVSDVVTAAGFFPLNFITLSTSGTNEMSYKIVSSVNQYLLKPADGESDLRVADSQNLPSTA